MMSESCVLRRPARGRGTACHRDLKVVQTEPGIKGGSATNVTKPAKLETGVVVQVPPFINEGEIIRIDTTEGKYLERAN